MRQRLVIQNNINGESVNVIYYHWSAYTESSIYELERFANNLIINYKNRSNKFLSMLTDNGKELIEKFDNSSLTNKESIDLFNLMTYFSVSSTSGSTTESLNYLSQFTTDIDRKNVNRNDGLLGITDVDQDDLLDWSEGTLIVDWVFNEQGHPDFEQTVFDFSNLFFTYNKEEFEEYYNSEYVQSVLSLKENPYQTSDVPLSKIEQLQRDFKEKPHAWKSDDNQIYAFIE